MAVAAALPAFLMTFDPFLSSPLRDLTPCSAIALTAAIAPTASNSVTRGCSSRPARSLTPAFFLEPLLLLGAVTTSERDSAFLAFFLLPAFGFAGFAIAFSP